MLRHGWVLVLERRPRVTSVSLPGTRGRALHGALVAALVLGPITLGACGRAPLARPHPAPTAREISAVNAQYSSEFSITLEPAPPRPRVSARAAVRAVAHGCGGPDVWITNVGVVRAGFASAPQWAVFFNPAGNHELLQAATHQPAHPSAPPVVGNWFVGFVGTGHEGRPFCTFGHSRGLPPLRLHRIGPRSTVPPVVGRGM